MSEEILKALTQLFAIISKQDTGVSEAERNFIISFYQQDLDSETMAEYLALYDKYSEYGIDEDSEEGDTKVERKRRVTRVNEAVRVLSICRRINKTLTQKQKVIVLFKLLEMLSANRSFTAQRMEIIQTVASVFNIPKEEYKLMESFAMQEHSSALDSEDILIFDDEPPPPGSKKRYIDSGKLDGEIIFIRVKSVDLYFIKYTGHDEIYLNGQLVKRNSIVLFSNGSIIKTPKGAPLYYSDLVSKYTADKVKRNISFNVDSVWFTFPNGTIGLRNINISEGPGKLIGIMGASGAGKTTLLNVMAGLEKPSQGKVTINGYNIHDPIEKKNIEGVIGYVSQDDLLIEDLTVFQNLYYNAKLCFRDLSEEEITAKVVSVLESLGLDRIMHLKVGNVLNKKISGGQRKRLNIALELIREPAILFLDEPTSGLSSRDSENVIDLLKELSLKGKLIFAVIHQPSSDIYKMFDKMYILDTGGYPVFYGNPIEAITYFKRATRQVGSERGQCMTCGNVNPEQIFNIIEARVVDEYGEFTNKRKITPEEWHEMFQANFKLDRVEEVREKPPKNLNIPSRIKQTLIFATRDALAKISNKQYLTVNLIEAPALALLMSLVIRYKDSLGKGQYVFRYNDNIPAYILICIIIALFMGLTVSAEEIISDRKILKRESFLNLSRTSYLFSKLIILFSLSAIQTLSFVVIGNLILGVQEQYITYWLMLFTVSCFANVLGLNISSAFDNAVTVYVLIPLLLIPQMILSGGIFSFDKLNNAIAAKGKTPLITDIWASRWAYEAICVEQFKTNPYERMFFQIDQQESAANYKTSFWLPKIDELLTLAAEIGNSKIPSEQQQKRTYLATIANELKRDKVNLPGKEQTIALLNPATFDEQAAEQVRAYNRQLNVFYGQIQAQMADKRDSVIIAFEESAKKNNIALTINRLKDLYHNEQLAEFVKNENVLDKTFIEGNRIIQNTDPVFHLPEPEGWWDYRTHFFAPVKHFAGHFMSTYYFNLLVIWLMTVVLYVALYFEWLRKFVKLFSKLELARK
ncbi:MAG: ATP-binding cassette domain-containing protein [Cytophagales bacterium]|nr:ATP-binding cassette domain-containing protein [Bernardetiaceae bacterium]MDW8209509.1 ATP-binding cassette domain-containing protein [Cytophagales bacterium]